MKENPIYTDIDLSFVAHPLTGDLPTRVNQEALKRTIIHLFKINPFDIPFRTYKSNMKRYLFETDSPIIRAAVQTDLSWIIKKLEPRIVLRELTVTPVNEGRAWNIEVTYSVRSLNGDQTFDLVVERVR
jgi:hypothetical protein